MKIIDDIARLEAIYEEAVPASLTKVVQRITPLYAKWINAARFCVVSTVGPDGTDCSPRGDTGPVVRLMDEQTLWLPDWRGNNRMDSLRNIVADGRISLMFMVPGASNVIRVNGTAVLTDDPDITESFEQSGKHPRSVIVITVGEAYYQCAKAVMRSELWSSGPVEGLPRAGQFVQEQQPDFDAKTYDDTYAPDAKNRLW